SYRVLFGRTGPFSLSVIFMQSKVDQDGARTLLKMLGERVRKAVARKPPDSGETVPKETPAGQPSV
ncbi:MAG: hypothetical protein ACE5ID_11275, partial [Acidobacteriota bacterium]